MKAAADRDGSTVEPRLPSCRIHFMPPSPFRKSALSRVFRLRGKLRSMPARVTPVLAATVVLLFCQFFVAKAAQQITTGVFVALGADSSGAVLTIQQGEKLASILIARDATARERAGDGPWHDIPISGLKAGEPIALFYGARSTVRRIEARYKPVASRLVTVDHGYVITTSGAAYKLVGDALSASAGLSLGVYLLLRTDPAAQTAFDIIASKSPLAASGAQAQGISITFIVRVPANTPASDAVYMATNIRNWTPNAIRMTPISGNRWTATFALNGGDLVAYKYTRGSWSTDERNPSGGDIANRALTVRAGGDSQTISDVVARWADLPS